MVGLVSPQAIPFIGHDDHLVGFLQGKRVSQLAVLDSWFVVANQRPLFQTGMGSGEVMQVFPFIGERTHFTSDEVSYLVRAAQGFVAEGSLDSARQALEQAIAMDPLSAHPRLMLASIYAAQGDSARAQSQTVEAQKLIDRARL